MNDTPNFRPYETASGRTGYNRFLVLFAGLGGLLYGVDVGIIAGALPYLEATSGLNAGQLHHSALRGLLRLRPHAHSRPGDDGPGRRYPSSAVKSATDPALKNDLKQILTATRPEVVYTHNPADKHDTHIGVVVATLQAMRELPRDQRPQKVIGCEVWRNLDWLPDADQVLMDVSGRDNLAAALNGVFDSQIAGGKRYDLATFGRRAANATFFESHATDKTAQLIFGMDLTPLVADGSKDIVEHVCGQIDKLKADVRQKLAKRLGHA